MRRPLFKWIFPFEEPPRKEVRIALLFAFALFLIIDLSIAILSLGPKNWEGRATTNIEFASMERIPVGEFGEYHTAKIEATNGKVYQIDSLLTKHLGFGSARKFPVSSR